MCIVVRLRGSDFLRVVFTVASLMEKRSNTSQRFRGNEVPSCTISLWKGMFIIAVIWPVAPIISEKPSGFISINCGGSNLTDPETNITWSTDGGYLASADELTKDGISIPATVIFGDVVSSVRENARLVETAMAFIPRTTSRSKYCYIQGVQNDTNYLVRVMFPTSNLTPRAPENTSLGEYSTRFYLTVDSTFISTIELDPLMPQAIELVVTPLDATMYICLVPLEDRSSMPAISTIELRPLSKNMYLQDRSSSNISQNSDEGLSLRSSGLGTTMLMTVARLSFGVNESSPAIRFPDDKYDRLWYAAGPGDISDFPQVRARSTSNGNFVNDFPNFEYPRKVLQTAWEGLTRSTNILITFNISAARSMHPIPTFYVSVGFLDVNPGRPSDYRNLDLYLEDEGTRTLWNPRSNSDFDWTVERNRSEIRWDSRQELFGDSPTLWITRRENSTLRTMVSAFEVYGEFAAETTRTKDVDGGAIADFADVVGNFIDTAGDPCLPVSWSWLGCSIEIPPRITQINLTSMGVNANITTNFGSLDRLTILDLSNNSFTGTLPRSLLEVDTLRELHLENNKLTGNLPVSDHEPHPLLPSLETLSLSSNQFTGNLSALFGSLGLETSVSSIDLSQNDFTGSVPQELQNFADLQDLRLSYNSFSGALPKLLFQLPTLRTLKLDNNHLTGMISDDIWNTRLTELQTVNLENNSFTALNLTTWSRTVSTGGFDTYQQRVVLLGNHITNIILPPNELNSINSWSQLVHSQPNGFRGGYILLGGNPWCETPGESTLIRRYLCRSDPSEDFWDVESNNASTRALVIGIVVSGVVVLVMACILLFFLGRMLRRTRQLRQIQKALAKEDVRPPIYSYDDLKAATKDFSPENQLGRGTFGAVYKGEFPDGSVVAVKRLLSANQSMADFLKEVVVLTGIKHRHLVLLKGCCVRDRKRLLVYEYAENQNLAQALWGKDRRCVLSWEKRLKIAVGIAKGLAYIHEELQPKILHRDIKAQNILLDKEWNAKIADFGLARLMDDDTTQRATKIGGTLGYFSPEYATQGLLTDKLDVYSYGILLLEIVSGRRCIDTSAPPEQTFLKEWAFIKSEEGSLLRIAEASMVASVPKGEIESVLKTALLCLEEDYHKRPLMSDVVHRLTSHQSDVAIAVDIVNELKDQQLLYRSLVHISHHEPSDTHSSGDVRSLVASTSTSTASSGTEKQLEMTLSGPR